MIESARLGSLLLHRPFVPQPDPIAVRIDELGTVAPVEFLRTMGERDPACAPSGEGRLNVLDLEPQRQPPGWTGAAASCRKIAKPSLSCSAMSRRSATSNSTARPRCETYQSRDWPTSLTGMARWSNFIIVPLQVSAAKVAMKSNG